jgi:long-chain-alcohol oxidase
MQVNENSDNNPCWNAISYSIPEVDVPREEGTEARPSPRPLDDGVVETRELNDTTLSSGHSRTRDCR